MKVEQWRNWDSIETVGLSAFKNMMFAIEALSSKDKTTCAAIDG